MKNTITLVFILFFKLLSFSQTRTEVHGRVLSQDNPIKNADVINYTTKESTTTSENGDFYIKATIKDRLIVISDNYQDSKIIISHFNIDKEPLLIQLEKKPIEIEEINITTKLKTASLVTYEDLAMTRIANEQARPRNDAVYTGVITNGMDFAQIGKMIGKLFKNKKKSKHPEAKEIDFKTYAKANFSEQFFSKTLALKSEEIELFLQFCEADSKSHEVMTSTNEFFILNFLIIKKDEFLKLQLENKK